MGRNDVLQEADAIRPHRRIVGKHHHTVKQRIDRRRQLCGHGERSRRIGCSRDARRMSVDELRVELDEVLYHA